MFIACILPLQQGLGRVSNKAPGKESWVGNLGFEAHDVKAGRAVVMGLVLCCDKDSAASCFPRDWLLLARQLCSSSLEINWRRSLTAEWNTPSLFKHGVVPMGTRSSNKSLGTAPAGERQRRELVWGGMGGEQPDPLGLQETSWAETQAGALQAPASCTGSFPSWVGWVWSLLLLVFLVHFYRSQNLCRFSKLAIRVTEGVRQSL